MRLCKALHYSRKKMTSQIENAINDVLQPKRGVAALVQASHQFMTTRGVHKPGVSMVTSQMIVAFRNDFRTRMEFLSLIG
jgi:GTP cyclohydrolase I